MKQYEYSVNDDSMLSSNSIFSIEADVILFANALTCLFST